MSNKPHKMEIAMFLIAVAVLGVSLYFLGPSITGFVVREANYEKSVNLIVTSNGNYTLELDYIGELKSLKLDGRITSYGKARVYIESNGIRYLVFDSSRLGESKAEESTSNDSNIITGFASKEDGDDKAENETESDKGKKEKNKKPKWTGADEFIVNGTTDINLSQHWTDEDGDELTYAASEADGIEVSIDEGIAIIEPETENSFNATITFIASDGIDSKSHTAKLTVIAEKKEIIENKAPRWNSDVGSFVVNGTTLIDISDYFVDDDNDNLTYNYGSADGITISLDGTLMTLAPAEGFFGNVSAIFTAFDGKNLTVQRVLLIVPESAAANLTEPTNETNQTINQTPTINGTKTININLSYKRGTIYDANDNGEESVKGVVDLSVAGTEFGWDADESKLCTRWEMYNAEEEALTAFCNGNNDCCAFVELLPTKTNWSEIYYSTFGKDGAGYDNIVSAQVLYYDVNLSPDNLKSEIYNSEWASLSVKFFEEEIEFFDECIDACSLSGFNKSSYTLFFEIEDDAILRIDSVKYSLLTDVANNPPIFLENITAINMSKNRNATINLSKYFYDEDNDKLNYDYYKTDNITIFFNDGIATIVPDRKIEGIFHTFITANDSDLSTASNVFTINVSQEFYKPSVVIGKPVKWEKTILIDVSNTTSVNITLPESASNLSITILNESEEKNISDDKIKIAEEGKLKDKGVFEAEKALEKIRRKISILEEAKLDESSKVSFEDGEFSKDGINSKLNELFAKESELELELASLTQSDNLITANVFAGLTGNVVALTEEIESINETQPLLVINESLNENIEVTIEYETEAPIAIESEINSFTKQIKIVSETSYEDVLSYITLNDVPQSAIKLYWLQNNERILFTNVKYYDDNANNLIDRIEWVIPHLSNQTFEVSITVLNVQSYPTVFGNWTVAFNTSGTGNLSIYGFDGTNYAEKEVDDSSTTNDLDVIELKCGNNSLEPYYIVDLGELELSGLNEISGDVAKEIEEKTKQTYFGGFFGNILKSKEDNVNNLPLNSENSTLPNKFINEENTVLMSGGCIRMNIIPAYFSGGNNKILPKCLSKVSITRPSELAESPISSSSEPRSALFTSNPPSNNNSTNLYGMFSSEISLGLEDDISFLSNQLGGVFGRRQDSLFGELRKVVSEYFLWSDSSAKELENLPDHYSGASESGLAMTDFGVGYNEFVDLDGSHKFNKENGIFKSIANSPLTDKIQYKTNPLRTKSNNEKTINNNQNKIINFFTLIPSAYAVHNGEASYPTLSINGRTYALLTKEQLIGHSYTVFGVYYPSYNCDNQTGYWTVKVLTEGVHNQRFNFSGQIADAHNFASAAGGVTNGSRNTFVDDTDVDFGKGVLNGTNVSGSGGEANVTIKRIFEIDTGGTLTTNLTAYWKMDEQGTSDRRDSKKSYDLKTNSTTMTNVSGIRGKAANFSARSKNDGDYLNTSDNADLSFGDFNFTIALWVKFNNLGEVTHGLIGKYDGGTGGYLLHRHANTNTFSWDVVGSDLVVSTVRTNGESPIKTGSWYFIVAWHDATNNIINISINNTRTNGTTHTSGVGDTNLPFELGTNDGGLNFIFNGSIDEVGIWHKVLSEQERTDLYNNGLGNTYVPYNYTGNFTSQVFDANKTVNWSYIQWETAGAYGKEIGRAYGDGFSITDDSLVTVVTGVVVDKNKLNELMFEGFGNENNLISDYSASSESSGLDLSSDSSFLSNSQSSSVLSALTLACFLSNASSDQMQSDSNLSATAKYSMSLACGEVSLASSSLSKNFSRGIKSTLSLSTPIKASNSSCEKPDLDIMSALFFSNSASNLYGAESLASSEKKMSSVLAFQPLPFEITAENSSLASATTFIYAKPSSLSCLSMPALTFLPSSKADSLVNLLLEANASRTALCKALDLDRCDSKTFNLMASSAISDQFTGNSSMSFSNSSGILIFNSGILSPKENRENGYLKVVVRNNSEDSADSTYSTISINEFQKLCPTLDCNVIDYITSKKKIKDIKEGDYVLSLDESTGKLKPAKVNALLDHGIKPIYEMSTEDGRAINTTAEHPYLVKLYDRETCDKLKGDVWNKNADEFNGNYCTRWVQVKYLEKGMKIAVPKIESDYLDSESESASGLDSFAGFSSNFNNSAVVKILTLDCLLNAASSDQIGKLNVSAKAKYGSSFVSSPCGEILLASRRNSLYSSSLNDIISLSSSEINSLNSSSLIFANFVMSDLLLDNSFKTKSGEASLHSCSSNFLNTSLLTESDLKNENRMEASTISSPGISGGICSHKPCLLATLFFNSSPSLEANSSVISLFFNISSNLSNASSFLVFFMNASLATSDQFTQEKCSISDLRESSNDAITLAIYNSPLCSSSNFLSNSTLFANALLITSAQFISGCLFNLAFNSSGIDTVNVAILSPLISLDNSIDKQKSVDIYKSFDSNNDSALVSNSSYYISKYGDKNALTEKNINENNNQKGGNDSDMRELASRSLMSPHLLSLDKPSTHPMQIEEDGATLLEQQDTQADRSRISEQNLMEFGSRFSELEVEESEGLKRVLRAVQGLEGGFGGEGAEKAEDSLFFGEKAYNSGDERGRDGEYFDNDDIIYRRIKSEENKENHSYLILISGLDSSIFNISSIVSLEPAYEALTTVPFSTFLMTTEATSIPASFFPSFAVITNFGIGKSDDLDYLNVSNNKKTLKNKEVKSLNTAELSPEDIRTDFTEGIKRNKYLNVCDTDIENLEKCKGRVAQWIEHLLDAEEDAGSNFTRESRRAHTDLNVKKEKEEKQAHSLDKTPSRRRGISHKFLFDSETAESHTVKSIDGEKYKNVSVVNDDSEIEFRKIKRIRTLDKQHVYDLDIENAENFVANDIIAHNTAAKDSPYINTTGLVLLMHFNNETGESERQLNETHNISAETNLVLYMPFDGANAQEITPNGSTVLLMHFNNDTGSGENASLFLSNATFANGTGIVNGTCRLDLNVCPVFNMSNAKFGKAGLEFNTSYFINISDKASLDLTTAMTLEAWVKPKVVKVTTQSIITKHNSDSPSGYNFAIGPSGGDVLCQTGDGIAWAQGSVDTATGLVVEKEWQHLACTYDGSRLRVYKDGILVGEDTTVNTIAANTRDLWIGADVNQEGPPVKLGLNSTIDEIAIWNVSLSSEVLAKHSGYGIDRSIYGNNASLMNASRINFTDFKFGEAMEFDGTDDQINLGDPSSGQLESSGNQFTLSAWIKADSGTTSDMIIAKKDDSNVGHYMWINGNGKLEAFFQGPGGNIQATSISLINDNNWHHVVGVKDTNVVRVYVDGSLAGSNSGATMGDGSNSVNARIGRSDHSAGPYSFNGKIDEVAVWNISLTPDKIAEHAGAKVLDYSQYKNNGTRVNQGIPDFGRNFTEAKFGKGLVFDGTNDIINLTNISAGTGNLPRTVSAWIKTKDITARQMIFSYGAEANYQKFEFESGKPSTGTAGNIGLHRHDGVFATTSNNLIQNEWTHAAVTYDGTTTPAGLKFYINGISQAFKQTEGTTGEIALDTQDKNYLVGARIEGGTSVFFNGFIDELSFWNISLTAEDIQRHYERGVLKLNLSYRTSNDNSTWTAWTGAPNNTLTSITGFSIADDSLVEVVEGVIIKNSELKELYKHNNYYSPKNISTNSRVEYTLISPCSLNASSLDQIAQPRCNANAKYGTSLVCGANSSALDCISSENLYIGNISILSLRISNASITSDSDMPQIFAIVPTFLLNSSIKYGNAASFSLSSKNKSLVLALPIMAANRTVASTTSSIYQASRNLLATDSEILSVKSLEDLSETLIFDEISLSFFNFSALSKIAFLATSDQSSLTSFIIFSNSSGNEIVIVPIFINNGTDIYKTFELNRKSPLEEGMRGLESTTSNIYIIIHPISYKLDNVADQNSGAFEGRLSVADFAVRNDILVNFDSHIVNNENGIFKTIGNPDYLTIPINEFAEICPTLDCSIVDYITSKKKIKDVKEGDYTLSLDESAGKLKPAKVKALVDHGIKPIIELKTESGKSINTTAEHPYLVKLYDKELCDKYANTFWNNNSITEKYINGKNNQLGGNDRSHLLSFDMPSTHPENILQESAMLSKLLEAEGGGEHYKGDEEQESSIPPNKLKVIESEFNENVDDEFNEKGYCTRWVEASELSEGMELAVPKLENVPRLLGGVKSSLKSLEIPPVLFQSISNGTSLVRLFDRDKLAHDTSDSLEDDEFKSFDSGRSGISELENGESDGLKRVLRAVLSLEGGFGGEGAEKAEDSLFLEENAYNGGDWRGNEGQFSNDEISFMNIKSQENKEVKSLTPVELIPLGIQTDFTEDAKHNRYLNVDNGKFEKEIKGSQNSAIEPKVISRLHSIGNKQLYKSFDDLELQEWRTVGWQNSAMRSPLKRVGSRLSGFKADTSVDVPALPSKNSGIEFEKIASITALPEQHVYDLSIEGTRNFIANDIIAHNTARYFQYMVHMNTTDTRFTPILNNVSINYTLMSNLSIFDRTDNNVVIPNELFNFTANFTDGSDPINGTNINCTLSHNGTGSFNAPMKMDYDPALKVYWLNRSFSNRTVAYFNVTCDGRNLGYNLIQTIDVFNVSAARLNSFNGSTTNIEGLGAFDNVSGFVLDMPPYGRIAWINYTNITGADFNVHANISRNLVGIHTAALHKTLNSSANITIYNMKLITPSILRDNAPCPADVCKLLSYNGVNITFNVTSFSNFSAQNGTVNLTLSLNVTTAFGGQPVAVSGHVNLSNGSNLTNHLIRLFLDNVEYYNRLNVTDTSDTDFIQGNLSVLGNFNTSRIEGTGTGANLTINISLAANQTQNLVGRGITPNASLLLYLRFEEGTGQYVNDSSIYKAINGTLGANNGAASNDPVWNSSTKFDNFGMSFDGVNDFVNLSDTIMPSGSQARSYSFWLYANSFSTTPVTLFYGREVADDGFYHVIQSSGQHCVGRWGGGDTPCGSTLSTKIWYHVAVTYDGTTANLYLNGQLDGSAAKTFSTTLGGGFLIGRIKSAGDEFNGVMDEISIWNVSLTNETILDLYQKGLGYFNTSNFTSRIFDFGGVTNWTSISWNIPTNYQYDLEEIINASTVLYMKFDNATGESERQLNETHNISAETNLVLYMPFDGANARELKENGSTIILMHFDNNSGAGENATIFMSNATDTTALNLNNGTCDYVNSFCPNYTMNGGRLGAAGLAFDGVNDFVNISDSNSLDVKTVTVEMWVKSTKRSGGSPNQYFLNREQSGGGNNHFALGYGASSQNLQTWIRDASNCDLTGTTIEDNTWTHVAMTLDGSEVRLYKNGALDASRACAQTLTAQTGRLYLGTYNGIDNNWIFNGTMDEVALWNVSLGPEIIAKHAGYGRDMSIYGNNASLMNGSVVNQSGKFQEAMQFTGAGNYIRINDSRSLRVANRTFEAWINFKVFNAGYQQSILLHDVGGGAGSSLYLSTDGNLVYGGHLGTDPQYSALRNMQTNTWHHIAAVDDPTASRLYVNGIQVASGTNDPENYNANGGNVFIGQNSVGGGFFNGTLDEVAIWNVTLTPDKIAEHAGAKVLDYSIYKNNGTRNFNSSSDFGRNYTDGKFSKALVFDGTNDFINISDSPSLSTGDYDYTVTAWVTFNDKTRTMYVASKDDFVSKREWYLRYNDKERFDFVYADGGATVDIGTLQTGTWYFLLGEFKADTNTVGISINNIAGTPAIGSTFSDTNEPLLIGSSLGQANVRHWNGSIDEFAIWNRTLSADEKRRLYERGVLKLNISTRVSNDSTTWSNWLSHSNKTKSELGFSITDDSLIDVVTDVIVRNDELKKLYGKDLVFDGGYNNGTTGKWIEVKQLEDNTFAAELETETQSFFLFLKSDHIISSLTPNSLNFVSILNSSANIPPSNISTTGGEPITPIHFSITTSNANAINPQAITPKILSNVSFFIYLPFDLLNNKPTITPEIIPSNKLKAIPNFKTKLRTAVTNTTTAAPPTIVLYSFDSMSWNHLYEYLKFSKDKERLADNDLVFDGDENYFVKRKVFTDLMGDDLNLQPSINSTKNPSKSSGLDLSLSSLENDSNNASGLSCGTLSQTIENILSFGNTQGSVKSSSLVTNTLFSDLESNANLPFESPFGLKSASYPSDNKSVNSTFFTFSSNRNLISFLEGDCDLDIISSSSEISSVMQSCLDMLLGEGCNEACNYLLNRHSGFKHLQNLPDHDSCTFESGLSVADFAVRDNILIDFDPHEADNENDIFKGYVNSDYSAIPINEFAEICPSLDCNVVDYVTSKKKIKDMKEDNYSNLSPLDFSNSLRNSSVLYTLTLDCLFNLGSFDQIAESSFKAKAKNGASLGWGDICIDSALNSSKNSDGFTSTKNSKAEIANSSSLSLLIPEYLIKSGFLPLNSENAYFGTNNSSPNKSEFTISSLTGFSRKNENNMFVLTTNFTYHPSAWNIFHISSFTFSPSSNASFSVNLLCPKTLSSANNNSCFFLLSSSSCLAAFSNTLDHSMSECLSISSLTSGETFNFSSSILLSPKENRQIDYLKVSDHSTIPISKFKEICPSLDCNVVDYVTAKKKIKDVKEGDYTLSLDENTGKLKPAKVNALLDHGVKPIYEMKTISGKSINTTAEHPYLVKLYNKELCNKYENTFWNNKSNFNDEKTITEKYINGKNNQLGGNSIHALQVKQIALHPPDEAKQDSAMLNKLLQLDGGGEHSLNGVEQSSSIPPKDKLNVIENGVNEIDSNEFESKGYCTRWVEVRDLEEGMEIAVPKIGNNHLDSEAELSSGSDSFLGFSSNFNNSAVVKTLTLDCFLNAASSDQIGQFNNNAKAKYGSSFACGASSAALARNLSYSDLGIDSIFFSRREKNMINSSSLIPEYFCILPLSFVSSSNAKSGEINLYPSFDEDWIIALLAELGLKKENNMLASTTKNIYINPCRLATLSFSSSPNLRANSSVILLFFNSSSAYLNNKDSADLSFSALDTNWLSSALPIPLAINSNSSGISTFSSAIFISPKENKETEYIKVMEKTAPYKSITFEKIAEITPLPSQHVYDLSIEGTRNFIANDIIAHNTARYIQYKAAFNTTDPKVTPILNDVILNFTGILTNALGDYNYTLSTSTYGARTVRVNTTFQDDLGDEKSTTLTVVALPVINTNYTVPTYPMFNRNVTIVANVTDANNNVFAVNFTLIAPNGTRINLTNGTRVGDLHNSSFNLTSYGTWLWNVTVYDSDGFIVNTTTIPIILMELGLNLNSSTTTASQSIGISGKINLSNGTNVSKTAIKIFIDATEQISSHNFTDDSDTDFNLGVFNSTNISGTGGAANLTLANNTSPATTTQTFSTATAGTTFVVPAGVTSITVKSWGGGGGSGGGSVSGGGGGFAQADIAVTPGESLTVRVGGGGGINNGSSPTQLAGGGGGYSGVLRSGTELVIAAGGGGGGGNGGGGAGGGTTGTAGGFTLGSACKGGGGTPSAGGAAGTGQDSNAVAGTSLTGGGGGGGAKIWGGAGGTNGGGAGGGEQGATNHYGGGGGGGGHFGGGGGDGGTGEACGGGGGSSNTTGTSQSTIAGSGATAGNTGDSDWATPAGNAGTGSDAGNTGRVVIKYTVQTYISTGNFTSRAFDAGGVANWTYISWSNTTPVSTNLSLYYRTSADNITYSNWNSVSNNTLSLTALNSTNRYFQYLVLFNTSNTNLTPIINNVTINYTGIFTDSFGNYTYTLTAPATGGTSVIKVNTTWANTIPGETLASLSVLNTPTTRTGGISAFIVQNASGGNLAVIDAVGNMDIKGAITQNAEPSADNNDFVIQNSTGGLNLVITNPQGNLLIKNSLSQSQSALSPTLRSFIIQNSTGQVVAYVNSTGALFLTGALTENVDFG